MPRALRFPLPSLREGLCPLDPSTAHYLITVHRLAAGAAVLAFDPESGLEAEGQLICAERGQEACRLLAPRPSGYEPLPVILIHALSKGSKPEQSIEDATALGVAGVMVLAAERSVVKLDAERADRRVERWRRVAVQAARQSGRGRVPFIEGPWRLDAILERTQGRHGVLLQPGAPPLAEVLVGLGQAAQSLCLLIGPEGGLTASEERLAIGAGFRPASLGSLVLRTELCVPAALGALVALRPLLRGEP